MISFDKFINKDENKKKVDRMIEFVYYNYRLTILDNRYTLSEFESECYLRIMERWNKYNGRASIGTYIGSIVKHTPMELRNIDTTQKRMLNNLNNTKSFEKEKEENGFDIEHEHESVINLNKKPFKETVLDIIPLEHKHIVKSYLDGKLYKDIAEESNLSISQVQHIAVRKYKKQILGVLRQYQGNLINF